MYKLAYTVMEAMNSICMNICEEDANVKQPKVREMLFQSLVAVLHGADTVIKHLGYTDQDIAETLERIEKEKTDQPS